MIDDGMPYDSTQGQGHGGPKVAKMASFNVCLLSMHVIKRLMVNYDTPRQHLNFNWHHVTLKLMVFNLW